MLGHRRDGILVSCVGILLGWPAVCHAQMLETETARPLRRGQCELSTAVEIQSSGEGVERAVPFAVEYGVRDRLTLLLEPVVYTAIRPNTGSGATGPGDLELTVIYLLGMESHSAPALAVAGEIKFPTAQNTLIGTGETDYTAYLIASKRLGRLDVHANVGYSILGTPSGTSINNIVSGAFALEYFASQEIELFGEVLGNTSASPEGGSESANPANPTAAEVTGGEFVGTLGVGARPWPSLFISLGVSYDNNQAVQFRPGITYRGL